MGYKVVLFDFALSLLVAMPFLLIFAWGEKKKKLFETWDRIRRAPYTLKNLLFNSKYLVSTLVIGFCLEALDIYLIQIGVSKVYFNESKYGLLYFALSLPALLLIYDLWFYTFHSIYHRFPMFQKMHSIHHNGEASPFSSFSFHPLEGFLIRLPLTLIRLSIPIHNSVYAWFYTFALAHSMYAHLGYEIKGFSPRFLITARYHGQHHNSGQHNFGLFFQLWDRIFGTEHPQSTQEREAQRARA